jgi:hypothetical protein
VNAKQKHLCFFACFDVQQKTLFWASTKCCALKANFKANINGANPRGCGNVTNMKDTGLILPLPPETDVHLP